MTRRSMLPYFLVSLAIFVTGLALGAGKSSEDTSLANTASKVLLTVGLLAVIVTGLLTLIARLRHRQAG